ncbi:MAG: hypothetical protein F4Y44_00085 [Chloroflexi bacterium]|nr:hypothetical protein [Chloroflexota bacterium]
MTTLKKAIPEFNSEGEDGEFWATYDSPDYVDWNKAEQMEIPSLNPYISGLPDRTVSITLPQSVVVELKALARKRDIPYKPLIKIYLRSE